MRNYILILLLSIIALACDSDPKDLKSFYKRINDPGNGLVKSRDVEGIKISVKYLPAEFLALKESSEGGMKGSYDSLYTLYKRNHTFLLSVSYTDEKDINDPMYKDLRDYPEYKARAQAMNFDMNEYVSIKTSSNEYRPVLTSMENTYSLKGQRNVYLVFADESLKNELQTDNELDFVFDDVFFQTGVNHFVFEQNDLMRFRQ